MMKLTVLVDNNTLIDKNFYGEPGLSFYIEEGDSRILFDTGYSDIFLLNARKMGIDLKKVNCVVLSHGHLDHTWGLPHLIELLPYHGKSKKEIRLITHPDAFLPKEDDGEQIGMVLSNDVLGRCFHITASKEPVWLSDNLAYLGEIPRVHDFENRHPLGTVVESGYEKEDYLTDDSALAYRSEKGLVIITGCSHSGICNIVDQAVKVCGDERIADIIGGFHLLHPNRTVLSSTVQYMKNRSPLKVHACHCTDLNSKIALSQAVKIEETGVGLRLQYK